MLSELLVTGFYGAGAAPVPVVPHLPGVAYFDYAAWVAMFPQFASVPESVASSYFTLAGVYLNNTPCSPVCDVAQRAVLLNMITAHLVSLYYPVGGVAPSGGVGQVTEATEGTVRVKMAEFKSTSEQAFFFSQTPYGLMYWAATGYLRRARYVPQPDPIMEPYGLGFGRYWPG